MKTIQQIAEDWVNKLYHPTSQFIVDAKNAFIAGYGFAEKNHNWISFKDELPTKEDWIIIKTKSGFRCEKWGYAVYIADINRYPDWIGWIKINK